MSVLRVPVLSKRQCWIFPAKGTRKGSVQKMPDRMSCMSAVLTASAICIGSCCGTTEVMMITHLSSSWCVVWSPFSRPFLST